MPNNSATSVDLVPAVDRAIFDSLLADDASHPVVWVEAATSAVMASQTIPQHRWSEVLQLVCERSIRRRHVLVFGEPAGHRSA
jgi:hypothetical protein